MTCAILGKFPKSSVSIFSSNRRAKNTAFYREAESQRGLQGQNGGCISYDTSMIFRHHFHWGNLYNLLTHLDKDRQRADKSRMRKPHRFLDSGNSMLEEASRRGGNLSVCQGRRYVRWGEPPCPPRATGLLTCGSQFSARQDSSLRYVDGLRPQILTPGEHGYDSHPSNKLHLPVSSGTGSVWHSLPFDYEQKLRTTTRLKGISNRKD